LSYIPFVYCLVKSQEDEIEILEECPLLDLVPEEHGDGVGERG
jgi:hypothetical protein